MAKIRFTPISRFPESRLDEQRAYSRGLGLPEIVPGVVPSEPAAPNLAVLGGSPEIVHQIDRLKAWDGEIWAINGAWNWCERHGINATFYRIDPCVPDHNSVNIQGVRRAILADLVEPYVFDVLMANGADVRMVRLGKGEGMLLPSTTAAATAPELALWCGHRHVTYFGCESSYGHQTHDYKAENPNRVWVRCGGRDYVTSPQMIMQAEWIAEIARTYPSFIDIACGGFLKALVEHGDYDITHICPNIGEAANMKKAFRAQSATHVEKVFLEEFQDLPPNWYSTASEALANWKEPEPPKKREWAKKEKA